MNNAKPLYQVLASLVTAHSNCLARKSLEWADRHEAVVDELVKEFMPSGSGFDSGTKLDWDATLRNPARLVFTTSFHHMDEDGWTDHRVTVSPSLLFGFELRITGKDRNDIKEYIHEMFSSALNGSIEHNGTRYFSPALREAAAKFQTANR